MKEYDELIETRVKTYALCEIGTIEMAVLGKLVKIVFNFVPRIDDVSFSTADESEPLESLMSTGTSPIESSSLLA